MPSKTEFSGFTLVELMVVLIVSGLLLLSVMAGYNFIENRIFYLFRSTSDLQEILLTRDYLLALFRKATHYELQNDRILLYMDDELIAQEQIEIYDNFLICQRKSRIDTFHITALDSEYYFEDLSIQSGIFNSISTRIKKNDEEIPFKFESGIDAVTKIREEGKNR